MTKAFLLLSGCGNRDGSEIHEATLAFLALDQRSVEVQCIAPDMPQKMVVDHFHSKQEHTSRHVIVESARIARGKIIPLDSASVSDADLLVIPGGLGAVTTFCTYFEKGIEATIIPEVKNLIDSFLLAKKPIVAICISPVLIALTRANTDSIKLTLGTNPALLSFLKNKGMEPVSCNSDSYVSDLVQRVVSTPAYNESVTISVVWKGIQGAIDAALSMIS